MDPGAQQVPPFLQLCSHWHPDIDSRSRRVICISGEELKSKMPTRCRQLAPSAHFNRHCLLRFDAISLL
jgi:hypothetical protein